MSMPASLMPRKSVPNGVPVDHATIASGCVDWMRAICALTVTSVGLKCS